MGICLTISWGPAASAAVYYVEGSRGNDRNPGDTESKAWRTIGRAAEKLVAGDVCLVLPGNYEERTHLLRSGRSGAPITFRAKGRVVTRGFTIEADFVHLSGFEISDTDNHWKEGAGIFVQGAHCLVENNFIHDVTRVGIHVFADPPDSPRTSHCVVRNNRILRAGLAGIEVYGRYNLIESNDISRTLQYPARWTHPPRWADADGLHFFGAGHIIRNNHIHGILLSDPENIDPHIDAIQTFGPAYDIVIERNLFEIPDVNMQIAMIEQKRSPVRNIVFRNNVFKNAYRGLNIWSRTDTALDRITIVNNTFVQIQNYAVECHNCSNLSVVNNLFYDVGAHLRPYLVSDRTGGANVSHNCHFMSDGRAPAGRPAPEDLWQVDPRLVNVQSGDFKLTSDSPLIDRGRRLTSVHTDKDGHTRPAGHGFDVGAYEYAVGADRRTEKRFKNGSADGPD
ncbi:MAG: right-handed parallel beta-helix repeat-containing protein [Acidobacteriota bacterium]